MLLHAKFGYLNLAVSPTIKNHYSPEATLTKVNRADVNDLKFKS